MDDSTTLYGAASIVLGGLFAFLTAFVSRPRDRPAELDVPAAGQLTTVAGIAAVVTQQGERIRGLEAEQLETTAKVGALTRYVRVLKAALGAIDAPVPEPDPSDRHLIDQ